MTARNGSRSRASRRNGFTLIELIAVVVIIGVIGVVAAPIILDLRQSAREGQMQAWTAQWSLASQGAYFKSMSIPQSSFVPDIAAPFTSCDQIGMRIEYGSYSPGGAGGARGWYGGFGFNFVGSVAMIQYGVGSPDDATPLATGQVRTCTLELYGLNGQVVPEPRPRINFPMWGCAGPFGGCNATSS